MASWLNKLFMIQIRVHGRGGQGVVTAAELIALSAFNDGLYAQAFPSFGVERSGAPIQAFARLNQEPIITREQVYYPNILIVQDDSLLLEKEVLLGINASTRLIINSQKNAVALSAALKGKIKAANIISSPATDIALRILGKNLVNTVILGTLARATGIITLKSLLKAVSEKFQDKEESIIKKNHAAVSAAYTYVP